MDERFLNRMQFSASPETLNGKNFRAGAFRRQDQTTVDNLTVQQNGARAALAFAAALFGAGQLQVVAKSVHE